jgi:aminopeptidase N
VRVHLKLSYPVALLLLAVAPWSGSADAATCCYGPGWQPPDRPVQLHHLRAELEIDALQRRVAGKAIFTLEPLRARTDSISFSVPGMEVSEVEIEGAPADYRQSGSTVWIYPPSQLQWHRNYGVALTYVAQPANGLYFVGWDDPRGIRRKQIWAHRPRGWLPFRDAVLTVDMIVRFDGDYQVFSNGERVSVRGNRDGTKTWHYRMDRPHPFFSTCLVIGQYEKRVSRTDSGVPLELCYYPDRAENVEATYRYTEQMFDFLERELGVPYPWKLYRQLPLADYVYSGMETTTSTVYGDFLHIDPRAWWMRNFVNVNVHELVHQWLGNYVSHLVTNDTWITEGTATYYAKLFEREVFGKDYYDHERHQEREKTLAAGTTPLASTSAGRLWYYKGSLVLEMMRDVMGDAEFRYAMAQYLRENAYQQAEIHDLLRGIYRSTGQPMEWFFGQWVCRGGMPHYRVAHRSLRAPDGQTNTHITVQQIQQTNDVVGLFRMPVGFQAHYQDGTWDSCTVWIEREFHEVMIPNPQNKQLAFVLFDPDRRVLKRVTFPRDLPELLAQAGTAPNMIDRYDALVELRAQPLAAKRAVLLQAYQDEAFHLNKGEILAQLGGDPDDGSVAVLGSAALDPDALVRRAFLNSMATVPVSLRKKTEALLMDSCYANLELALTRLVDSFPEDTQRYLAMTSEESGWQGKNVRMKWLEIAIGSGLRQHLQELVDYSSPSYDLDTRRNALEVIARLGYLDTEVMDHLFLACVYWNPKLSKAARQVLDQYLKENSTRQTLTGRLEDADLNDAQRSTLARLMER